MNIYLLYHNNYDLLPYQLEAIRKYLPETENVYIAEGPFRPNNVWDAKIKLSEEEYFPLGIHPYFIAGSHSGSLWFRYHDLMNNILQKDGNNLILQSDCIPCKTMTMSYLLQGKRVAGRWDKMDTWCLSTAPTTIKDIKDPYLWKTSILDQELHIEYCEPGFIHLDKITGLFLLKEKLDWLVNKTGQSFHCPKTEKVKYGTQSNNK